MSVKNIREMMLIQLQMSDNIDKYMTNTDYVIYPDYIREKFYEIVELAQYGIRECSTQVDILQSHINDFSDRANLILKGIREREKHIEVIHVAEYDYQCLNFMRVAEELLSKAKSSKLFSQVLRGKVERQLILIKEISAFIDSL